MILTSENYYSPEANMAYMSVSQYKSFRQCEAATMAQLFGEHEREDKASLLVGSYVHAWNEGCLAEFQEKYRNSIFNKKGEQYAEYRKAEEMISTLERDPFCMSILQGSKEVLITAEFAGAMWKGKLDVRNADQGYFVELKTTRSIADFRWSDEQRRRVSFIEEYKYMIQAAIYSELERLSVGRDRWLTPLMIAVSKEDPPDHAIISLEDEERFLGELYRVQQNMPRILAVKSGLEKPKHCGVCRYCRATKSIDRIIHYTELMPA